MSQAIQNKLKNIAPQLWVRIALTAVGTFSFISLVL